MRKELVGRVRRIAEEKLIDEGRKENVGIRRGKKSGIEERGERERAIRDREGRERTTWERKKWRSRREKIM